MNKSVANKVRKQSAEQKTKQIEKSRTRYKENRNHSKPVTSDHPSKGHEDIQREKGLRKRAQKQTEKMQKKLDDTKQLLIEQNQQLRNSKKKTAKLEHERFEAQQRISTLETLEVELSERDERLLLEQERRKEAERMMDKLIYQPSQNQRSGREKINLSNQVKQLKESNKALHKQMENYDLLAKEKYGNLEQEVKGLRKEVHTFRNREREIKRNPMFLVNYMKKYITSDYLPDLLDQVQDHIKTENLDYFYHGDQNVFYTWMRRVNMLKFRSQRLSYPYKLKSRTNSNDLQRLGYVCQKADKWLFVDVTEADCPREYDILANSSREPLTVDRPAKAIFSPDGNGVEIVKWFHVEVPTHSQHIRKQKQNSASRREYLWFGNFNVLVIGSRFLSDYKHRLEKHGCYIELHNPFEEGYEVLKGKISRAEIILVCERHIPHSMWYYVDKKQPYVNVLKQDSKDLIATFTYLTLQRCELI